MRGTKMEAPIANGFVPIIDLSARTTPPGRQAIAGAIDRACTGSGFFVIVGTGSGLRCRRRDRLTWSSHRGSREADVGPCHHPAAADLSVVAGEGRAASSVRRSAHEAVALLAWAVVCPRSRSSRVGRRCSAVRSRAVLAAAVAAARSRCRFSSVRYARWASASASDVRLSRSRALLWYSGSACSRV